MKPIFLIVIMANIILSCGKKKENNTNITEQDVFAKAPYDTTAIDSFHPEQLRQYNDKLSVPKQ